MARRYSRRRQANQRELIGTLYALLFFSVAAVSVNWSQNGLQAVPILLYIIAALGLLGLMTIGGIQYLLLKRRRQRLMLLTMADVDHMSGLEFERYVAELFRRQGYRIQLTPINDYGVDIIIVRNGIRTAVQVKRYSKPVNQAAVREVIAGMAFYRCSRSMVVTNSVFTRAAVALAQSNNCTLLNRDGLAKLAAAQAKTV